MAELVDIFDVDWNPTGEVMDKAEALRLGKYHKVVVLWIVNSHGEVLLQKRSMGKRLRPGMLDVSVSGHVGAGETGIDCIVREAREELSIDINPKDLIAVGRASTVAPYLVEGFVLRGDFAISDFVFDGNEVAEVKFVPWRELAAMGPDELQANNIVNLAPWHLLFDYMENS
ncbi:MAG: NUDIX domain-containing protein [Alphaproteobacteria bacterium]|nr:NUDIX domain-containing protein [Alphaproteobacteria bacterium]